MNSKLREEDFPLCAPSIWTDGETTNMDAIETECWASTEKLRNLLDGSTAGGAKCVNSPGNNALGMCDMHFRERFGDLVGSE